MISDLGQIKQDVTSAVNVHLSIFKIVDSIEKKFHAGNAVKDMDELRRLRAECEGGGPLVSVAACQGLVRLVLANVLPLHNTVSALLASVFSVKHLCGVTSALTELLTLDLRVQLGGDGEGAYVSPWVAQHPLVALLKRRPLACPDVINHMAAVCCHPDERVRANRLALVRPVLSYILMEVNDLPAACTLQAFRIVIRYFSDSPFLIDTFASCLCWDESRVLECLSVVEALCDHALQTRHGQLTTACCLALCCLLPRLLRAGLSPRPALLTLSSLAPSSPHAHSTMLAAVAPAIPACPAVYLDHLLTFVCDLIATGHCSGDCVWMCAAGLLPWLASTAPLSPRATAAASRLIGLAASASPDASSSASTATLIGDRAVAAVVSADECLTRALQLARLSEQLQDGASCSLWLARVGETASDQVYHYCCALLLGGGRNCPEVRLAALRAIVKAGLGACHSIQLTVLLYQLAREEDPQVQLALLQALPATAVDKSNVGAVLATLDALHRSGQPRLVLLAVDLHARLWLGQPRCYPQLMAVLNQPVVDPRYGDPSLVRLLHASICCLICDTEPEKHGKEAVLKVSELLGGGGGKEGATAASTALAIRALVPLCRSDVVDVYSIWRSLAPKFAKDKRPPIVDRLCELASVSAVQKTGSAEADSTRANIVRWLWGQVETGVNDKRHDTVTSALRALSKFRVDQMSLKALPECLRRDLKLPAEFAKTPVDAARKPEDVLEYIPGECWAQLLRYVATEEASRTVSCWMKTEIASFRSHHYQVDRAEPTTCQHLPQWSVVRGIVTCLQKQCSEGVGVDDGDTALARLCLRALILGATPKPLPALAWPFLSTLADDPDVLRLAAKQSQISPSARKITERFIDDAGCDKSKIECLYAILDDLGRGIPPTILRPFLERTLQTALIEKEKEHFSTIIKHVENTLKEGKIHDANKTLLNQLVKGLWDLIDSENELAPVLMSCVGQLPASVVESLCSTSLMWEVTPAQLRKAFRLRAHMALHWPDTDEPLNWINEIVEVAADNIAEQRLALELITEVVAELSGQSSAVWSWLQQLMGQAHLAAVKDKGGLDLMVAVFVLCVDIMSHFSRLSAPHTDSDRASERALRFPQAVVTLVTRHGDAKTMLEWLVHMASVESMPSEFAAQFQLAARSLSFCDECAIRS